ncbi:hypothetical protein K491DRAFT_716083 [Lophiostoma macrostomum CBS 122681]|uniref:Uncharacterized protein n=1 Tax=Lophiostoma macrostomum CBS 122681 TaxID=1314788 RepID=A0A6A6T7K2_9PLEO|nr:hypothetical protein K491DRAFT_716083 [Lophiostoma macrostomum CBS 122681]
MTVHMQELPLSLALALFANTPFLFSQTVEHLAKVLPLEELESIQACVNLVKNSTRTSVFHFKEKNNPTVILEDAEVVLIAKRTSLAEAEFDLKNETLMTAALELAEMGPGVVRTYNSIANGEIQLVFQKRTAPSGDEDEKSFLTTAFEGCEVYWVQLVNELQAEREQRIRVHEVKACQVLGKRPGSYRPSRRSDIETLHKNAPIIILKSQRGMVLVVRSIGEATVSLNITDPFLEDPMLALAELGTDEPLTVPLEDVDQTVEMVYKRVRQGASMTEAFHKCQKYTWTVSDGVIEDVGESVIWRSYLEECQSPSSTWPLYQY